jgi:hypothetical protein
MKTYLVNTTKPFPSGYIRKISETSYLVSEDFSLASRDANYITSYKEVKTTKRNQRKVKTFDQLKVGDKFYFIDSKTNQIYVRVVERINKKATYENQPHIDITFCPEDDIYCDNETGRFYVIPNRTSISFKYLHLEYFTERESAARKLISNLKVKSRQQRKEIEKQIKDNLNQTQNIILNLRKK